MKAATPARPAKRKIPAYYPLEAPGMPAPGPNFADRAKFLAEQQWYEEHGEEGPTKEELEPLVQEQLTKLYHAALRRRDFSLPVRLPSGRTRVMATVPGHIWGDERVDGPRPAEVMLIGKCCGEEEVNLSRNLAGPTSQFFLRRLEELRLPGIPDWYVTNLIKHMPPENTNLKSDWIKDNLPLLHQELRIVRPKYILCLGADAIKALLGKKWGTNNTAGRVFEHTYPIHLPGEPERYHTAQVMTLTHPAQVYREPGMEKEFDAQLLRFGQLIRGIRFDLAEEDVDHRVIDNEEDLVALIAEMEADCTDRIVAVDAEWHGKHPQNKNAYVVTVQVSWAHKKAACIVLRHNGQNNEKGPEVSPGWEKRAVELLLPFFKNKRVGGHYLTEDMPWLISIGLDLREQYAVPPDDPDDPVPAWEKCREQGGWDTALMLHAFDECCRYGLENVVMRFTDCPPYWVPLSEEIERYRKENGLAPKEVLGFGELDPVIRNKYACLHGNSLVQLADGSWEKIKKLVSRRYSGKVKAFYRGKVIDAPVIGWHRHVAGQKEWFKLRTQGGKNGRHGLIGPVLTPDHEVLTRRGKIRVDQLEPGADAILTDEREFSSEQLSVFLGCLLGDGGFTRQNSNGVGFRFSQRDSVGEYAAWKARVFATHGAYPRAVRGTKASYQLPFSRHLYALSLRFPTTPYSEHRGRKVKITPEVLDSLGDLGLAVWYQDDGTLAGYTSRIYCRASKAEIDLAISWLRKKFGNKVVYNTKNRFIQFSGEAFRKFQAAIRPFMHPAMAYKSIYPISAEYSVAADGAPFYDPILDVVPVTPHPGSRGNGVRYCLSVGIAGNFLTQAGFVSNCYDADATRRAMIAMMPHLDSDQFGHSCWETFWRHMRATPAIIEIHCTGVPIDKERVDRLTDGFMEGRATIASMVREWAKWPDFNIRSVQHVRELLFGEELNGKKREEDGRPVRIRPEEAKTMNLMPIMTTDKRPIQWTEVIQRGEAAERSPSTNKLSLAILAQDNPDYTDQVLWLRNYRFIDQALKSILREPDEDESEGGWLTDDEDSYIFSAGLAGAICDDGRVRTHIFATKETSRWSSTDPNLMAFSNQRDRDYKVILGDAYKTKLKSIVCSAWRKGDRRAWSKYPTVLVSADWTGAELCGTAWMSGDPVMTEDVRRNLLPEDHPDYYDIHSGLCRQVFKLPCEAKKKAIEEGGWDHLRTCTKTVVFGYNYGRGAKAIQLAVREQKIRVEIEEIEAILNGIDTRYARLPEFFALCESRAVNERWLQNAFGTYRRFPEARDEKTASDFRREARAWPIQSWIAEALNLAVDNAITYRRNSGEPDMYRILLPVHDCLLFEVPVPFVEHVVDYVIPKCMCDWVPMIPTTLDGQPVGRGPYHLGVDVSVSTHWGEKLTKEQCRELGLNERFGK